MFKDTEIIAALIAGVTVLVAEIMKIGYTYFKDKKDAISYFIDNDYEIDKKIWNLLKELNANRVYVGRFHNGGVYADGVHIQKFSVTNEAFSDDVDKLIMPEMKERPLYEFTNLFRPLIYTGSFEIHVGTKSYDKIIQKYMEIIGGESAFLYCIKSMSGKPTGFLGVHFEKNVELTKEKQISINNFSQALVPFLKKKD